MTGEIYHHQRFACTVALICYYIPNIPLLQGGKELSGNFITIAIFSRHHAIFAEIFFKNHAKGNRKNPRYLLDKIYKNVKFRGKVPIPFFFVAFLRKNYNNLSFTPFKMKGNAV